MNSIRAHLLVWQLSALLIAALIAGTLTYAFARRGFDQVRDYGLEQIAHSVLRHDVTPIPDAQAPSGAGATTGDAAADDGSSADGSDTDDDPDQGQFVSQIWSPSGDLVVSSLDDDGPALQPPGFHEAQWQGQTWRIFTLAGKHRTAQVAITLQDRDSAFYQLLPWVLVPTGLLVVLLTLMIHEAVKRALRPLEGLRQQIGQRAVSELHALDTENLPTEVAPLALTLNQLLARLDQLLANQREFLADAAHELNTPLAAIKLQAQLARSAPAHEREDALNELDAGIERAVHLASQLLQLARLEPDERTPERGSLAWHDLVRQAVIQWSPMAEQRGIDLGLLRCEAATVQGDAHALRALMDNLIDNALRYSPRGSQVDVDLSAAQDWAELAISDNGPGIPAALRERAMQRFVRLHTGSATGSGLGLAIVDGIVQRHGGTMQLDDTPGGGLTIRIRLPLSVAPDTGA